MAVQKNFIVKNGLQVDHDLLFVDSIVNKIGIGTTNPKTKLEVFGGIGATDINISGISTVLTEFNVGSGGTVITSTNSGLTGFGTASPIYIVDIRSPVSAGLTALYVYGDARITGDLFVDDIEFDYASITNLKVTGFSTIGTAVVTTAYINTGVVTTLSGSNLNYNGIGTITTLYSNDATFIGNVSSTNLNVSGIASVNTGFLSTANATSLNVSGIASISVGVITTGYINTGIITTLSGNNLTYTSGSVTNLSGTISTTVTSNVTNLNVLDKAVISVSTTSDALRVTQSGSGNALVVEDSTNPDLTPFVVTGLGSVGIATTNPLYTLDVRGDINFTGSFWQNGSPFIASKWTSGIGNTVYRSSGNVGIATTNPLTPIQIENIYGIKTGSGSVFGFPGNLYIIDSFTISQTDFKTSEYTIHVGYGTYIQSQKVLVMQDGTSAYSQEYAIMYQPDLIVSIGATITSGEMILRLIPEPGINGTITYRFVRETML